MSIATPTRLMTLAEFQTLPDLEDGVDRLLFRGEVVEEPMTRRSREHASVEARIAKLLGNWLDAQNQSFGCVFSGEVGCELPDQNSSFGIDVAVFSNECLSRQDSDSPYIVGPPILAIEVLSPSDSQKEIQRKLDIYLAAGVLLIWVVDPHFRTVIVHQPDAIPEMKAGDEQLSGGEILPGFCVPVSRLFG